MKRKISILAKGCMALATSALLTTGCSDDFLAQDPLSFYNPENTYTTEAGLQAAMAMCDYGLKEMLMDGNGNVLPMASLYFMTDIGLYAKTDAGDMQDDFANKITPTSGMKGGGDENAMERFWNRTWNIDQSTGAMSMTVTPMNAGKLVLAVQMKQGGTYEYCISFNVK